MTDTEPIRELVNNARDEIVRRHNGNPQAINGACHENAIFLCDYILEHTDWQPYLRWGAVNHQNYEFDDVEDAEESGAVHFWVEVQPDDEWVYADLFSMKSSPDGLRRGDVFASKGLPETYQPLKDTLFEYDPTVITPNDILSYMDYQLLTSVIDPIK